MRLIIQIEFDRVLELETKKTSVVLGRSPNCDLVVNHPSISRKHCKIEQDKGHFYITDLGSSNGVSLDGKRLKPESRTVFLPGVSQIRLGTMECEITDDNNRLFEDTQPQKIISASTSPSGEYTQTIRLARLDIKKELSSLPHRSPQAKLELEKKNKPQRPRNPVSGSPMPEKPKGFQLPSLRFIVLLLILLGALWIILDQLQLI